MSLETVAIDTIFESGHEHCRGGQVKLTVCPSCAEFLADALHRVRHQMEEAGGDDALLYYLSAFEADIITQIVTQTFEPDSELAELS